MSPVASGNSYLERRGIPCGQQKHRQGESNADQKLTHGNRSDKKVIAVESLCLIDRERENHDLCDANNREHALKKQGAHPSTTTASEKTKSQNQLNHERNRGQD